MRTMKNGIQLQLNLPNALVVGQHSSSSLALVFGMIVAVMGIEVGTDLSDLAGTIKAQNVDVLVNVFLACNIDTHW